MRRFSMLAAVLIGSTSALAQSATSPATTIRLTLSASDFQITNTFSDIDVFEFDIEIFDDLTPKVYTDPSLGDVVYQVMGTLVAGTPSGFPSFDLQRTITGLDFYAQGSSLSFEIAPNAVLSDGVQVAELVGTGTDVVFTFNGREIDNGRFHPALLELRADGTGRIQNSNNVPTLNPRNDVPFGAEYITDLVFDPGNLTIMNIVPVTRPPAVDNDSGGGAVGGIALLAIGVMVLRRRRARY